LKIGKNLNAINRNAKSQEPAPLTYFRRYLMKRRERYTAEELHARLVVSIGIILAIVFAGSVFALLWALVFVTQPMKQAPNDAAFIDLVATLTVFLTGTLAGIVSANGLKSKPKQGENNVSSTQ
jgi:polyferredoxin